MAAVSQIGAAATGDHATAVNQRIERALVLPPQALAAPGDVCAPARLVNLPSVPAHFVGRTAELDRLDRDLEHGDGVLTVAIHGLGGVGKSTLAAQWAAYRAEEPVVWWVNAETPASLTAGLSGLACALHPVLEHVLSEDARKDWAVRWLGAHDGWLLILDNVTTPEDVRSLIPLARAACRILITSRYAAWYDVAVPLPLEPPHAEEARELLLRVMDSNGPRNHDGADALCTELGHLPLAIRQAGAYCLNTHITPQAYLGLLARYPAELYGTVHGSSAFESTVARVWRITLDRLDDTPLAGELLRTLAWFDAPNIPRSVVAGIGDPPEFLHALGCLAAHNMVTLSGDTIDVHRLVKAVSRTPDPVDPHRDPAKILAACTRAWQTSAAPESVGWPAYPVGLTCLRSPPQWILQSWHQQPRQSLGSSVTARLVRLAAGIRRSHRPRPRAVPPHTRPKREEPTVPTSLTTRPHTPTVAQQIGFRGPVVPVDEETESPESPTGS